MNLMELIKEFDLLNKKLKKLDLNTKYYLVICNRFSKDIFIYNKKDISKINDYYIESVANALLDNELKKVERYLYTLNIDNEVYDIRIGVDRYV